jgi:putative addiction module component (TIGR02574 family)
MASTLSDLKKKAAQLPEQERAELALSLIESLDGPADADVEKAWAQEIERRVRQVEKGEAELIPAEEVFARIRRRLG